MLAAQPAYTYTNSVSNSCTKACGKPPTSTICLLRTNAIANTPSYTDVYEASSIPSQTPDNLYANAPASAHAYAPIVHTHMEATTTTRLLNTTTASNILSNVTTNAPENAPPNCYETHMPGIMQKVCVLTCSNPRQSA